MNQKRFFEKDLQILWKKFLCPICEEPSGTKSRCYDIPKEERRQVVTGKSKSVPLNIYSDHCQFRSENIWVLELNYPVSLPIINCLQGIEGVERIVPAKPYVVQISIGSMFDEIEVKKTINLQLTEKFKKFQSMEASEQNDITTSKDLSIDNVLMENIRSEIPDLKC